MQERYTLEVEDGDLIAFDNESQEHYFINEHIIDLLNEQNNKIKELQGRIKTLKTSKAHFKKVAETVVDLLGKLNRFIGNPQTRDLNYYKVIEDTKNHIEQLKEQLEDSEALKINAVQDKEVADIVISEYEQQVKELKQSIENLQKLNGETITLNRTVTKDSQILEKENEQLKQSLEYANKQLDYFTNKFRGRDFKRTGDWATDIELYMKQLATSELKKVKEYNRTLIYSSALIEKFIDKQIEKLKHPKLVTDEYDNATEEKCLDDLNYLTDDLSWQYQLDDLDKLISKARDIENIAKRLKELKETNETK